MHRLFIFFTLSNINSFSLRAQITTYGKQKNIQRKGRKQRIVTEITIQF